MPAFPLTWTLVAATLRGEGGVAAQGRLVGNERFIPGISKTCSCNQSEVGSVTQTMDGACTF